MPEPTESLDPTAAAPRPHSDAPETSEQAASPASARSTTPILGAILRPGRSQIIIAVLLALLGFAFVAQNRNVTIDDEYAGMRTPDLVQTLNGLQAAATRANQEIRDLTQQRDELLSARDARETALQQAREELAVLGVLAGTAPAEGPGIVVTVTPGGEQVSVSTLLDAIEELRDAGAEAIEFNQRIRVSALSYVSQGAQGLEVDGQPLAAPYTISVIGEPRTLLNALEFPGGLVDVVSLEGGDVVAEEVTRVEILSLKPEPRHRIARPVVEE